VKAREISCGDSFTLILDDNNRVWSFGKGSHGRLGTGSDDNCEEPVQIELEDIKFVSAGCRHASAVSRTGKLYTWGFNFYEQLGLGTDRDIDTPTQVNPSAFKGAPVEKVSCGYFHTSALTR
jgi:alpha-tubulin suppressor-like RCC1 family protein